VSIGDWIYGLFGDNGEIGILLCIFLIFLIDALIFPTLPELFFVLAFMAGPKYRDPMVFGVELLVVAIAAEVIGILTLYLVAKHLKIPKKIEKAVNTYTGFLLMGDERLLLLNRVAPMIPFAGAFIAISKWDIKKSMFYIIFGCILKYGAIMLLSDFFYEFFSTSESQTFTIIMIIAVIIISYVASVIVKKRNNMKRKRNEEGK